MFTPEAINVHGSAGTSAASLVGFPTELDFTPLLCPDSASVAVHVALLQSCVQRRKVK